MNSNPLALDAASALPFLGQSVLIELRWDDEPDSHWMCAYIVGLVLPVAGVYEQSYFLAFNVGEDSRFPNEVFFSDIHTIRAIRHRDRRSSGNVLDRMTRPSASRSGAALPAHRDGNFVAMNGSTGAAHP
ncbi:hypothetical protein [Aquipseudomonas alcaligenes]|uniref:hypothetical protein n=1 Tax=Aquipseudomonas alcaligenes TaxID=43263 RepID=UPI00077FF589|nr:hypothetical protein [Pseudomonas alcaligenes]AMR68293.1 hypothetical protein A0T30_18635 [Pseudomonas alcaligenes]